MIPLEDARARVLAALPAPQADHRLARDSLGLVLAADIRSPSTVPPFDNSAMDGYAVRHEDLTDVPCVLEVSEGVAAGHVAVGRVEPGRAIKIMTGAPLPAGADTVVKVEDTIPGEASVEILARPEPGNAIRRAGGDVSAGDLIFSAGDVLTARHLGVLAAVGVDRVEVCRPVRVAVLSTGDEVMPPDALRLAPGEIRDSNRPLLVGLLAESGMEAVDYGIIGDDAGALRTAFATAARECDAVITSGGVSMGEYDLVKEVLTELGGIELWKVAMQPAKPFAFRGDRWHAAVRPARQSGVGLRGIRAVRPAGLALDDGASVTASATNHGEVGGGRGHGSGEDGLPPRRCRVGPRRPDRPTRRRPGLERVVGDGPGRRARCDPEGCCGAVRRRYRDPRDVPVVE